MFQRSPSACHKSFIIDSFHRQVAASRRMGSTSCVLSTIFGAGLMRSSGYQEIDIVRMMSSDPIDDNASCPDC